MKWKIIGLGIVACAAAPIQASSSNSGHIHALVPVDNAVLFNHDGSRSTQPACATTTGRWAISASTPVGQAKVAVLLTAFPLGKTISVIGSGQCDVLSDTGNGRVVSGQRLTLGYVQERREQ